MATGKNNNRTGYYVSSAEIKERLEQMKKLDLQAKEPEYNVIILKMPNGDVKIKTKLTKDEWIAKYKANAKKKDLKTFNDIKND